MQLLKAEGVIGVKACKAIVYKISDVLRMFGHWNVAVPQVLYDILANKVISTLFTYFQVLFYM